MHRSIRRMSVLQIDAINTVKRSHYLPLFSRLGNYDCAVLDHHAFLSRTARRRRRFFEYWGHECSILPIDLYPLLRWRMADASEGVGIYRQLKTLAASNPKYIEDIRRRVCECPSTLRELDGDQRGPGMWQWSRTKQALEYLFATGQLACLGRQSFQRIYAAPERVIPDQFLSTNRADRLSSQARLMEIAATALGIATEADLRDYFRLSAVDSAKAMQLLLDEQRLVPVQVDGWQRSAYGVPGFVVPRQVSVCTLLSPFDPLVWYRERLRRLFDFEFRIEIYIPEAQRQYGYWVMPLLLNENIVARFELKADREQGQLRVLGAWAERGVALAQNLQQIWQELNRLGEWLGLATVHVSNRGDLAGLLRKRGYSA